MIGKPFINLDSVDSTNNYAMEQLKNGLAESGTAYFAQQQTQGKGQRSKTWFSEKGSNIILSVILDTTRFQPSEIYYFNYAVALAVFKLFNKYSAGDCSIKWPNDLYWRDRKAGGVLIENVWKGEKWVYSIAGMGININQVVFGSNLKAVSLRQITGKFFEVEALAKELCFILSEKIEELKANKEEILSEYNINLYKLNTTVTFKKQHKEFSAAIKGADEKGRLIIFTDKTETINHGEVDWIVS